MIPSVVLPSRLRRYLRALSFMRAKIFPFILFISLTLIVFRIAALNYLPRPSLKTGVDPCEVMLNCIYDYKSKNWRSDCT